MSPVVVDGADRCVSCRGWLVFLFGGLVGWVFLCFVWLFVWFRAVCFHGLSDSSRFRTKDVKPTFVSVNGRWTCSGD